MGLRQLRRRLSPHWLRSDARRHWRNVLFRRFGIQRCYTPPLVTQRPDLLVGSWLPYVVAYEILKKREFTFLQIGAFDGESNDDLREAILAARDDEFLEGVAVGSDEGNGGERPTQWPALRP